ncbi:MAG: TonB-dependent receptor [Bacteroidetes bacterium]|uniref:TonB-dependent receptor n=1 Tax=Candidatus Cryptobacteroides faecigallinarum TaxID=2840763 RepID=A0A9D9INI2_9BACT|nr:TonB-dependent receptor [Candidatus Cryptobacteroides faecigallinarum]
MNSIPKSLPRILLVAVVLLFPSGAFSAVQPDGKVVITGSVSDEYGQPLTGAVVIEEGVNGTVTDGYGNFSIEVEDTSVPLHFSYLGYQSQEIIPGSRTRLDVIMLPDKNYLDDVVVIGYGTRDRRSITTSIASVKQDEIEVLAPVATSVQDLLGGAAKGVLVTQNSGEPGAVSNINIRGITSPYPNFNTGIANNAPLYVIDGVAQFVDDTQAINPLQSLSPNEIESIDILKDASATAIYGSRGANGVIIVNTKKGRQGDRMSVEFGYSVSIANPVKTYDPLNNEEYLNVQAEALQGSAAAAQETLNGYNTLMIPYSASILVPYGLDEMTYEYTGLNKSMFGTASTDWDKLVRNRNAMSHTYYLAVRGGTQKSDYSVSFNGINQEGLYLQDNMQTYNGRISVNTQIVPAIKVGALMNYSYSRRDNSRMDELYGPTRNYKFAPDIEPYDESAEPTRIDVSVPYMTQGATVASPIGQLAIKNSDEATQVSFSAYTDIRLLQRQYHELKLHADISANIFTSDNSAFEPSSSQVSYPGLPVPTMLTVSDGKTVNTSINFRLDYDFERDSHSLNAILGYSSDRNSSSNNSASYSGFPDDKVLTQPSAAQSYVAGSNSIYKGGLNSVFARASYNYSGRYFADLSLRADQSSKFGPNNRWAVLPAVSAGWMISGESFMENAYWVNLLKLRLGWGRSGSTNVPDFSYIQYYEINTGEGGNIYGDHSAVVLRNLLPNPNLRWEITDEWNIGLDFSLLNDRFYGSVDAYYRYTDGALAPAPHMLESGMSLYYDNVIDVSNRGVEISLGGDIVRTRDFSLSSTVNLSLNRNRVESLNSAQLDDAYQDLIVVGQPTGVVKGYVVDHIAQDISEVQELDAKAQAAGYAYYQGGQLGVGDYIMKDTNNDGRITSDDRVVIASPEPKFFGGWNTRFRWKNLTLSVLFQYSVGSQAVYSAVANDIASPFQESISREVYGNTWTPERTDARYPRLGALLYNYNSMVNDRFVFDASYFRLKNLTLGYALPEKWAAAIHSTGLSVFFTATNLFTVTRWPGIDPETIGSMVVDMGINDDPYPLARSFTFGVNLKF